MLVKSILSSATLLFSTTSAIPYLPSNSTILSPTVISIPCMTMASTLSNTSFSSTAPSSNPVFTPSPKPPPPPPPSCPTFYPTDITILNSRYPNYTVTHLQQTTSYIQLRREKQGSGEIATRVQFTNLPSEQENKTCRLDFIPPDQRLQVIQGNDPSLDIYVVDEKHQARSEEGGVATWGDYMGALPAPWSQNQTSSPNTTQPSTQPQTQTRTSTPSQTSTPTLPIRFGTINGSPTALNQTRQNGGVVQVASIQCNCSLAFDVGMKYDGVAGTPNYWAFENVVPPAWPVQGFRVVVVGC